MKLFLICIMSALGISLISCSTFQETLQTLECNRQAIERSTQVIHENAQAIEEANQSIAENRRQIEEINQALKKASGG